MTLHNTRANLTVPGIDDVVGVQRELCVCMRELSWRLGLRPNRCKDWRAARKPAAGVQYDCTHPHMLYSRLFEDMSMYTYIHTLHYITLHYITLHYITLHYITLHYITYIHTLHTYTHILTYLLNYVLTYLRTYTVTYFILTYLHTLHSLHTYIHTYMHACMHTYIHVCMHAYIHPLH